MMIKRNSFNEFHKGSNSELASTIILVVMREHRDQLALVWLALMSRCKNTSFKLWTRQTPGRGPVLSYWDQSLWNCCWISSWSKHIKMHSTKLALGSCLYFKVERNRENRRTSQADQAKAVFPVCPHAMVASIPYTGQRAVMARMVSYPHQAFPLCVPS